MSVVLTWCTEQDSHISTSKMQAYTMSCKRNMSDLWNVNHMPAFVDRVNEPCSSCKTSSVSTVQEWGGGGGGG